MNIPSQKELHELAKSKGFWDNPVRSDLECLMLITTEIAEAAEEVRNPNCIITVDTRSGKPEGLGIELADAVIRIMDYAEFRGIDLERMINIKHEYNKGRPHKHGKRA